MDKASQTVFFAKLSLNDGLQLFHNFLQVGDTIYSDDIVHSGIIIGLEKMASTDMTPDEEVLFKK